MSRRVAYSISILVVAVAGGGFLAGRASSDEPKPAGGEMPPEAAAKMADWMKMATPGPQHELLKPFVGTFVGTGAFTEEGFGTMSIREEFTAKPVFGGRFLEMDTKMTTEPALGPPMSSRMYLGFDNAKQKFVHVMFGDMSTAIGSSEGTYDPATKTFTMIGTEVMGPGKERKYRMTQRVVSNDEWVFELYFTGPDGKETKSGSATYKRS
jgi:hypothetical protein